MADPLTPTPEQIAAMEARGWVKHGGTAFVCGKDGLRLEVYRGGDGWFCEPWVKGASHPDPLAAADEAEAWLRSVLAGFRFPWLQVTP